MFANQKSCILIVFTFEQTPHAPTCQTAVRLLVTQVQGHVAKSRTQQVVKRAVLAAPYVMNSPSEDFPMSLETISIQRQLNAGHLSAGQQGKTDCSCVAGGETPRPAMVPVTTLLNIPYCCLALPPFSLAPICNSFPEARQGCLAPESRRSSPYTRNPHNSNELTGTNDCVGTWN